jgi:MFS family permease
MNKLWTKDFLLIFFNNFLTYMVYYILIVIIALYAMVNLHANPSVAGLASGIFMISALFARLVTGRVIEQVGRKKMLYIGTIIYFFVMFFYFKADSIFMLCLTRFLHGIGLGIATTASSTIAAIIVPRSRQGEGLSYFMLGSVLASAIGSLIGTFLYHFVGFTYIIVLCIVLIFISFTLLFFLKKGEAGERSGHNKVITEKRGFHRYFEAKALPISCVSIMIFFAYASIISFVNAFTTFADLKVAGNMFFFVYSFSILLSRPITGKIFDRKGANVVIYPAFIIFIIGLVVLSQANNTFALLFAAVFTGIGFGNFSSCARAIAVKGLPDERISVATSTFLALSETGTGIGPFFIGYLISLLGYRNMYLSMAGVVLVAMFIYYKLYDNSQKSE